jgi:hypothetical protein
MDKDHISKEEFLLEFFGNFGRELGNPPCEERKRYFTNNPNDIFECIEFAEKNKFPAFITVNPFERYQKVLGIEKIFFDFDFGKKKEMAKWSEQKLEERKVRLYKEVENFLYYIKELRKIVPMVVKTRRGFHIHIFLDKVYALGTEDEDLIKEVYLQLQLPFIKAQTKKHGYKFMDTSVLGDVKRFCRIPTSKHQETGEECILIKSIEHGIIIEDKLRGIDYYRTSGLKSDNLISAVAKARDVIADNKKKAVEAELARQEQQANNAENWELEHGFVGKIRYCFQKAMDCGEASHQLRLALLLEGYWAGYKTIEDMVNLFKEFHDFNEKTCRDQVEWFFKNKVPEIEKNGKWKPYRCTTLEALNICSKSGCPIYQKRKEIKKC